MSGDVNTKSIWSSIFLRKGGSSICTRLWEDWGSENRAEALRCINLQSEELPVILVKPSVGLHVILTTRRLFFGSDVVSVQEIIGVKPSNFTKDRKNDLNELDIELSSGANFLISISPGPSYFSLWNVLLHISRKNVRKLSGFQNQPLAEK